MNADVLLLAAGFGTRLRPLTDTRPKPLIELGGRTLIGRNLELIARSGFTRVIINLHYLGSQIRDYVGNGSHWGLEVSYSEEPVILDTGGAIRNIEPLLKEPDLLTINSDIIIGPDFSLADVLAAHRGHPARPLLTMVLRRDPAAEAYGAVGVSAEGKVVHFLGKDYGPEPEAQRLMFLGITAMRREVLNFMPPRGEIFSITRDTIRKILESKGFIGSIIYGGYWSDIGTPERLELASKEMAGIFGTS